MRKLLATCCFALSVLYGASVSAAPFPSLSSDVGVCDPNAPTHCIAPDASGAVPITGTISASLGGFTPSASGARGTPLPVTTADSSGSLPTGAVVIVSNVGTTNPMYCNVNGVAATTADQLIGANSWFAFTIPNLVTTLHCIATGGSTTANALGGAGLPTGAGGGSAGGSGGGGAITAALGSYAAGALSAGALATGAGVDGWDLTQGARGDAAWTTGSGSVIALLKAIATSEIVTNRAVNVAQINGVTPLMGNGGTGTGSPRVTIASDNTPYAVKIDQTTPGTTNLVALTAETTKVIGTVRVASGGIASGGLAAGSMVDYLTTVGTKNAGTAATSSLLTGGVYNSSPLTLTTTQQSSLQLDANGYLKVNTAAGAAAGGTSSNFGSVFPTPGTAIGFTDGTNMQPGTIKAASTAPVATDKAIVVVESPNSPLLTTASTCLAGTAYNTNTPITTGAVGGINCNVNGGLYASISHWGGTVLGAASNYGTSPGAVAVPGVNAFVTNTVATTQAAATTGGSSTTGNIAANNTTAVVVKASAGTLYGVQLAGLGSAPAYLKIYNATSATCGSGTPVKRLMIPAASTAANGAGSNITFGATGINFSTGITYCVTTGIGDSDTTAPAASTFLINVDWL